MANQLAQRRGVAGDDSRSSPHAVGRRVPEPALLGLHVRDGPRDTVEPREVHEERAAERGLHPSGVAGDVGVRHGELPGQEVEARVLQTKPEEIVAAAPPLECCCHNPGECLARRRRLLERDTVRAAPRLERRDMEARIGISRPARREHSSVLPLRGTVVQMT